MSNTNNYAYPRVNLSRRRFVQGLGGSAILASLGIIPGQSRAATYMGQADANTLSGKSFDLTISEQMVNFSGVPTLATTINGSLPAPILHMKQGDEVTIRVTNLLKESSSIHWHGLILPSNMDGVPDVADQFSGIPPGETFVYRFKLQQSGTYWYHSHSGFQEQTGLYGAIVIDPVEPDPVSYDRDHVVLLSDWSDEDPMAIYKKLKKLSHYYNFKERTHSDLMNDIDSKGLAATWEGRQMWNKMRMNPRDLSDVTGYTYTYLMNGVSPASGWTGLFRNGEKIRLRFINASAMTFFDVRIPGLKMTVVAADGQDIEPVTVDEFRIGVAETFDVVVQPDSDSAYTLFAQAIDRSGYARGTLTPDPSLVAQVPAYDPVPELTHIDMGMDMDMNMGSMDQMAMGQDMSAMNSSSAAQNMSAMDHSMMGNKTGMASNMQSAMPANPSDFSSGVVIHPDTEYGAQVDMRAEAPKYRLDDPGVGLRGNGRKVLTYADIKNLHSTIDEREPDREIELHLTGNMRRYMWSIDGVKRSKAEPLRWKMGERLRITLVNDTMMNHPMHLHGMWSDLETGDNNYLPRKHTIVVQPGARVSYRVSVDAPGGWAYHCHLLYHMLGMFRTVIVT